MLAYAYVGVHQRTPLISFSLLFQQYPAGLVHLSCMVCEIVDRWPKNSRFLGYLDSFKIVCYIFVSFPSSFFLMCFISVHAVHLYSSMDIDTRKKSCFILSDRLVFHMINNLSIPFGAFTRHTLTSLSVDEILLMRYVKWSINFRCCFL